MTQKLVIITGTGRCGTSFVAEVFRNAGLDPGGVFLDRMRAGFEYPPLVQINTILNDTLPFPECPESQELLKKHLPKMQNAVKGKRVVKDPRLASNLDVWVHADLIERVILMERSPSESMASAHAAGTMNVKPEEGTRHQWWWARIGYLTWVCDIHNIPRTVIRFPSVVRGEGEEFRKLVKELTLQGVPSQAAIAALRAARRPDLVYHSPRRT